MTFKSHTANSAQTLCRAPDSYRDGSYNFGRTFVHLIHGLRNNGAYKYKTMKSIFVTLLIAIRFLGYSQNTSDPILSPSHPIDTFQTEIHLKDSIDPLECGLWKNGDYALFIQIQPFIESLQNDYSALLQSMQNDFKNDSATLIRYKIYAARYLKAINQLIEAESGFDLWRLVLYVGSENAEQNKGNSVDVEIIVRKALEKGDAAVFYKGQRIFKLYKRIVADSVMSNIKIYFEDDKNYAFSYIGHINW